MSEPKKRKAFSFLVQVDVDKETHVALAARLGIVPSALNAVVENRKGTKKC
jgi:hypothetical protein